MTSINLPSLDSANTRGKKVFVRCDFDVPIDDSKIVDDTRLISSVSTIEYLLENGAMVVAGGHLGRPEKDEHKFSLEIVAKWFAKEFNAEIKSTDIGGFGAWRIKENFYILENLRFYKGEEENNTEFNHKLAYIVDVFVNEAFGSSHRVHGSIVGVAGLLPHFAGFHFSKEVKILSSLIDNPRRPFTFVIGGAKIETKLPLISKMHKFADYVLVGGELAEQTRILAEEQHKTISGHKAILIVAEQSPDKADITEVSVGNFEQIISTSSCVVWNGPMGFIEEGHDQSTKKLAEAIIGSNAYKVVGGGDTIGYLNKQGLLEKFDFVSVGGGAMLEFMSGISLPGVVALLN